MEENTIYENLNKMLVRIIPGNPVPFLSINTLLEPNTELSFGKIPYFYYFRTKIYLNPGQKTNITFETEQITIP